MTPTPRDNNLPLQYFNGDDLFTPVARRHGLPIGNLTSQIFANLYLNTFDHWIKETLRVSGYIRYVDDIWIFANNKKQCWQRKKQLEEQLALLRLTFHPDKVFVYPAKTKQDVLGYQLTPIKRWLRNDNGFRFRKKLKHFAKIYSKGNLEFSDMHPSIMSWVGHASHGETKGLKNRLFKEVVFCRH